MYSQNNEELYITNYFTGRKGVFADFGANQGTLLSNTYALALHGWSGIAVEPSPDAFKGLRETYKGNVLVELFNCAVGEVDGEATLYHSGTHLKNGDVSLLSSLKKSETERWKASGEKFEEITVQVRTVERILRETPFTEIQMISLDVEGLEIEVLRQLDLKKLKTELIVVEHNGNQLVLEEIIRICDWYGLKNELLRNAENIILCV